MKTSESKKQVNTYASNKAEAMKLFKADTDIISNSGENDFIFWGLYDNGTLYTTLLAK